MTPCPLPLVALRGDETCPRCGRPAREHRGHPTYQEETMTETNEPTLEQIELLARAPSAMTLTLTLERGQIDLRDVAAMAFRTLDAEAKLAEMTERTELAERECAEAWDVHGMAVARAEKAEREQDEATKRAEKSERDWYEAFDRGRAKGREDVAKYSRTIGEIEAALGIAGAAPMRDTVAAVREALRERDTLRAKLSDAERKLDEALSANDRITAMVGEVNELFVGYDDPVAAVRALIDDYRAATTARERLREALADARAKLAAAPQDAPAPTTDARLDCESSSLLLLSTWARKVMMRPKNREKGVPSESIRTLLWMARDELFEAYSAIEEDAPTDDILAELGDAAAIIAFAMREVESRRAR